MLIPLLRALKRPVAVFIDSVDEYFNKHIHTPAWRASFSGELSPDIWFLSQMSLVEVAYQLRRITKHLKVYASVRKEAFNRLAASSPMVQQYRGSAIDASYSEASLKQIFANNVLRERKSNLAEPDKLGDDPIAAFLGRTSTTHTFTGIEEDSFDYIERHTLLRPRDLMTVGQKLAAIEPDERANERDFKRAVNEAASEIVQEYLNEVAPHLGDVDLAGLLAMIPANVLTREVVDMLAARYDADAGPSGRRDRARSVRGTVRDGIARPGADRSVVGRAGAALPHAGRIRVRQREGVAVVASLSGAVGAVGLHLGAERGLRRQNGSRERHRQRSRLARSGTGARASRPSIRLHRQRPVRSRVLRARRCPPRCSATSRWLTRQGINVWYDEGIPAGSRWSDELAARIRQASLFLFFVSPNSVHSNHCINEVNFVSDLDKPFVAVQIQDTILPDGMKLMIGAKQTIRAFGSAATTYRTQMRNVLLTHLAR